MIPEYKTQNIRNIAVVGHSNTGKTTLVEDLLYFAGRISEDEKGKICDFDEEEQVKGFSIHNSLVSFEHNNLKVNIIDTPGISDFVADVFSALRAVEGAIVLVDAEFGIQVETEKIWHYADEYRIPRAVFINKMDKDQADFFKIVSDLEIRFKTPVLPIELPIGKGNEFKGIISLIEKKAFYPKEGSNEVIQAEIPLEYQEMVNEYYDNLKLIVAESSELLETKYLEGEEFTEDEIKEGLRECVKKFRIIPITCGAVEKNVGVRTLLKIIELEMPSPNFVPEVIGTHPDNEEELVSRNCNVKESFCGFVFKTRLDQYTGQLSYFKVRSGSVKSGDTILMANKNIKEKIAHVYIALGEKIIEVPRLIAGDIGILSKTEQMESGDTITDIYNPLILPKLRSPQPIYYLAIHHEDKKMEEKYIEELHKVMTEDLSFSLEFDPTTKEHLIKGMGDLHLQLILDKISRKLKSEIKTTMPLVPYKETMTGKIVKSRYKHKKQSGGRGQYGEVVIEVQPLNRGEGFLFEDKIFGGRIPKQFIPGVEKGLVEAMQSGELAGFPVVDLKVSLVDGSYHSVDSSELAFKIAASLALKKALETAKTALLEPVMKVKVHAEREIMGELMNDLTSRRGQILEMHQENAADDHPTQVIEAFIPLKEMLNYALELKSISKGKASFDMEFDHYDILPDLYADKVVSQNN